MIECKPGRQCSEPPYPAPIGNAKVPAVYKVFRRHRSYFDADSQSAPTRRAPLGAQPWPAPAFLPIQDTVDLWRPILYPVVNESRRD